jgi:FAD/FMN-containing dehydrogenase
MSAVSGSLADRLEGRVLSPADAGYDEARRVWNAMVDRRPDLIAQCVSATDVAAVVRFARERGLEIGIRCGGHGILGLAVPDGGLMIDLTPMAAVRVDPASRRAWAQGGALLGTLDRAAQRYGLATTAGNVSHTGVGGLTLGGGMGWLARQYGLTCDNVVSFEVVTADGAVVRASATERPELYWGLRGGGGNFGIVTEFEFRIHPVGTHALLADFSFSLENAGRVLRAWRDLNSSAPREATFTASIVGEQVTVGFVWVGNPLAARPLLTSMRALGVPASERVKELSYIQLQTMDDNVAGHTFRRYWRGHYFTDFSDEAIDAFVLRGDQHAMGGLLPAVSLQAYGGAIANVPDADTAFSQRDTTFEYVASARWSDPAEDTSRMAVARACAGALEPFAGGAYVNTLTDEGIAGIHRAYPPEKLARLVALKDAYDPDNIFHRNQNIAPSSVDRATHTSTTRGLNV